MIGRRRLRNHGIAAAAIAAVLASGTTAAGAPTPPGAAAFVRDHRLTRYRVALADLNGDHRPEALIYAMATAEGGGQADLCGSGGCDLYVLAPTTTGYRRVTTVTIVHPPIRVLATTTHGWHDLGVGVAGGGITTAYEARLRFDGRRYPSNPTVAPAMPVRAAIGRQVIGDVPLLPKDG